MNLLSKRGFYDTLEILDQMRRISIHEFYKLLHRKSYYNAHLRVREAMIQAGLIKFEYSNTNRATVIILTEKGKQVCHLLAILKNKLGVEE